MRINPETLNDGYKTDHRRQYPDKTQIVFSNATPRKTRRENVEEVVFFGLQYFIKEYLINLWNEKFFSKPKDLVLKRFARRINNYLGPNEVGTRHIEELHDLGYLPIKIMALPEGSLVPLRVAPFVFFSTDERFAWLTNYLETIMSVTIWGPSTSATTAFQYRKLFNQFALETVGNTEFVQWQGHDFSFRGMFGFEAACMSGAGHLTSFAGTDTIPAIDFIEEYYYGDSDKELIGGSVAATEHSVACSTILNFVEKIRIENAGTENEVIIEDELMALADIEYVRHLITDIYPTGIVSIVSDSFDYWNTITNTARALKDTILARKGKVVFRPDTGDPVKIVCGYTEEEIVKVWVENDGVRSDEKVYIANTMTELTPNEIKGSIECLWDIFGGTITEKGYKLLDSHVGLIYGDSITLERARQICQGLKNKEFASINLVYGIGSYTYQYVTRDTDGWAVKSTWVKVDGKEIEIYKKPKTDDGTKNSAKGLIAVYKNADGKFYQKDGITWDEVNNCAYRTVFENSVEYNTSKFADIRARIADSL